MADTTDQKVVRLETQVQNIAAEVSETKAGVASLIIKVDGLILAQTEIATLKIKIESLEVEVKELKGVNSLKNTLLWVGLVASCVINVLVIYQLFAGGK